MGMDSSGNMREITKEEPIRDDEIPLTEAQAEQLKSMSRAERRRVYRLEAKKHRKEARALKK